MGLKKLLFLSIGILVISVWIWGFASPALPETLKCKSEMGVPEQNFDGLTQELYVGVTVREGSATCENGKTAALQSYRTWDEKVNNSNLQMFALRNLTPLESGGGSGIQPAPPKGFVGQWEFGRLLPQFQRLCTLRLTSEAIFSGFVIEGCHPNESRWQVSENALIFYNASGVITSRLRKNQAQNRWEGPYLLEPSLHVTHYARFISTWELSTNRPWGDYQMITLGPEWCRDTCDRDPQCRAWTFSIPVVQGEAARCWLKSSVTSPIGETNCISGVKGGP